MGCQILQLGQAGQVVRLLALIFKQALCDRLGRVLSCLVSSCSKIVRLMRWDDELGRLRAIVGLKPELVTAGIGDGVAAGSLTHEDVDEQLVNSVACMRVAGTMACMYKAGLF